MGAFPNPALFDPRQLRRWGQMPTVAPAPDAEPQVQAPGNPMLDPRPQADGPIVHPPEAQGSGLDTSQKLWMREQQKIQPPEQATEGLTVNPPQSGIDYPAEVRDAYAESEVARQHERETQQRLSDRVQQGSGVHRSLAGRLGEAAVGFFSPQAAHAIWETPIDEKWKNYQTQVGALEHEATAAHQGAMEAAAQERTAQQGVRYANAMTPKSTPEQDTYNWLLKQGKSPQEALEILKSAGKTDPNEPTVTSEEGIFVRHPGEAEVTPLTYQGKPLQGKAAAGNRDDKAIAIQQKRAMGQPLTAEEVAYEKAYKQWVKENKIDPGVLRAEMFVGGRPVQVVDPNHPENVQYTTARNAIQSGAAAPSSIPFQTEKGVQKAFTTGKPAEELVAFNTAIQHADLLSKAAKAMRNSDVRTLNSMQNRLKTEFGLADVTNFKVIADAYTREVNKALTAGHITDAEIKEIQGTIPANASPQQIMGAVKSYRNLMQSKVNIRKEQYEAGRTGQPNFGGQSATTNHSIMLNGKQYQYKGSGDTGDLRNYTEIR